MSACCGHGRHRTCRWVGMLRKTGRNCAISIQSVSPAQTSDNYHCEACLEEMNSRLIQLRSVVSPRERKQFCASDRSSRLLVGVPAANLMFFGTGARLRDHPRFCPRSASSGSQQPPSSQSPVQLRNAPLIHTLYPSQAQRAQLAQV